MNNGKRILSLILLLLLAISALPLPAAASSPAYYYWGFEDTAAGSLPDGFTTANGDGATYHPNISYRFPGGVAAAVGNTAGVGGFTGDKVVYMSSWFTDPDIRANRWMITPAITVPAAADLEWKAASQDPAYLESYNVLLSTTGNRPEDFTVALKSVTDEQGHSAASHSVSLDAYAGETVYLAFQLVGLDKFMLMLDDIYVGPETFFIHASAGYGGTITPHGATRVLSGEDSAYIITPNPGYRVASVLVDGVNQGAITSYTFRDVRQAHTIAANFMRDVAVSSHALTTTFAAYLRGANGNMFDVAVTGTLPVEIEGFDVHPSPFLGSACDVSVYMREGTYVGNETSMDGWTLVGTETVISGGAGDPVLLNIGGIRLQPGRTYGFLLYSDDGLYCSNGGNTYADDSLTITTGNAISDSLPADVSFVFTPYTWNGAIYYHTGGNMTATAGPGGSITPDGTTFAAAGSSLTYTITPNPGYQISSVLVDGAEQGAITSYTFGNIQADHTIAASFAPAASGRKYTGPAYMNRILRNASGVIVAGNEINRYAGLSVQNLTESALPPELKEAVSGGRMLLGYDIRITGGFRGPITLSLPVGAAYEGQSVTILHYINGRVETYTAVVENGMATITVNSLSPFVVLDTGVTTPQNMVLDPPKTGGATTLPAGVGLLLMGLSGIILLKKRRTGK